MKKLSILSMFIALMACIACQRQQREERKNSETQREMQERAAAEHQAQEQQHMTHDEAKPNPNEKAPQMISTPASSASPSTGPEKRYRLESQAQKFQPRRVVPMTSPIGETPTPTPTPTSSEPPIEKRGINEAENQKSDRQGSNARRRRPVSAAVALAILVITQRMPASFDAGVWFVPLFRIPPRQRTQKHKPRPHC